MASVTLILLLVLSLSPACDSQRNETADAVDAGRIIQNPNEYIGKTVTVTGSVENIYGPQAFQMDGGVNFGELLVLGADPFPQVPDGATNRVYIVNDNATVTGVVRRMMTAEIEREVGWDLAPELEARFQTQPVLIARSSRFAPARAAASPTATSGVATASPSPTASPGLPPEVQEFARFVRRDGSQQVGLNHEYVSTGIRRMSAALLSVANRADIRDQNIDQKRELFEQRANGIQTDPRSLQHADQVRVAFLAASDLLADIQRKRNLDMGNQMTMVRQAAEAVRPRENLLDQIGRVETFFQRVNDALQSMT